tara:strand:- start:509 stop:4813 length:4305 start_codon:yes stop_codon:yes gene_type:complete
MAIEIGTLTEDQPVDTSAVPEQIETVPTIKGDMPVLEITPQMMSRLYFSFGQDFRDPLTGEKSKGDIRKVQTNLVDLVMNHYEHDREDMLSKMTEEEYLRGSTKGLGFIGDEGLDEKDLISRGLIRGGLGLTGGMVAARAAGPLGNLGVPGRIGQGLLFLGGVIAGEIGGDEIQQEIFGEINYDMLFPEDSVKAKATVEGSAVAPYLLMPYLIKGTPATLSLFKDASRNIPKAFMLGGDDAIVAQKSLQALTKGADGNKYTQAYVKATEEAFKNYAAGRGAKPTILEKAVDKIGMALAEANALALRRPVSTGAAEGVAVPFTAIGVGKAREEAPGSMTDEGIAILAGGVLPSVLFLNLAPALLDRGANWLSNVKKGYQVYKDSSREGESKLKRARNFGRVVTGQTGRQQTAAIQQLLEYLYRSNEDPLAIAKKLEELYLDENGKLRDDVLERIYPEGLPKNLRLPDGRVDPDVLIPIFSGIEVDSNSMLALERGMFSGAQEDNAKTAAFQRALAAQRGILYDLANTGDPDLIKIANDMQSNIFEALFTQRHKNAMERLSKAVEEAYPNDSEKQAMELSRRLVNLFRQQNKMFRGIEKSAYERLDKYNDLEISSFQRTQTSFDEAGSSVTEVTKNSNIPNFVEEWVRLIEPLSDTEIDTAIKTSQVFNAIARQVADTQQKLGINLTEKQKRITRAIEADSGKSAEEIDNLMETPKLFDADGQQILPLDMNDPSIQTATGIDGNAPKTTPIAFKELNGSRKLMGALGAELSTKTDNLSRIARIMEDAYDKDLASFGEEVTAQHTHARNLTRGYYQFFRRTFGGKALTTNANGELVVDANQVTKALTTQDTPVAARIEALEKAGDRLLLNFQRERNLLEQGEEIIYRQPQVEYVDGVPKFVTDPETGGLVYSEAKLTKDLVDGNSKDVRSTTELVIFDSIRSMLRTKDNLDGTAEQVALRQAKALQDWANKNEYLLDLYPDVKSLIRNSSDAFDYFNHVKKYQEVVNKRRSNIKLFSDLTRMANPVKAITAAIDTADDPIKELNRLITLAKNSQRQARLRADRLGPEGAKELGITDEMLNASPEDLKLAVRNLLFDYVYEKSGNLDDMNLFKPNVYLKTLFGKIPGAKSEKDTLVNFMRNNGLITEQQASNMNLAAKRIAATYLKDVSRGGVELDFDDVSFFKKFLTQSAGARAGILFGKTFMPGTLQGAELVQAQAGSNYLQQILLAAPAQQKREMLQRMILNPELLYEALKTPKNEKDLLQSTRKIFDSLKDLVYVNTATAAARVATRATPRAGASTVETEEERAAQRQVEEFKAQRVEDEEVARLRNTIKQIREQQSSPMTPKFLRDPSLTAPRIERLENKIEEIQKKQAGEYYERLDQRRPEPRPLQSSMASPAPTTGQTSPQTTARLSAAFPEDDILALANPTNKGIASLMG